MLSATLALLGRTFSANLALIGAEHWKILVLYPAFMALWVSLVYLLHSTIQPLSQSLPWLYTHNLFPFISEEEFQGGEEKKDTFFPVSPFFFFVLLIFQLGICSSMAHPTPSKMHWKGAICGFPLLIYFQKTLQSDINCFDGVHLFVITHRCQLSCLVLFCFVFFLSLSNILALHPNVCMGSAQRQSVRSCHKGREALESFWCRENILGLPGDFLWQMGPTHAPLWESLDSSPWAGCTRVQHIPSTFSWQRLGAECSIQGFSLQQSQENLPDFPGNIKPQAEAL